MTLTAVSSAGAPGEVVPSLSERWCGWFVAERERWILWIPVFAGAGIATYFSLMEEPPAWPAVVLATALGVTGLYLLARPADQHPHLRPAIAAVLAVTVGFAAAQVKAVAVATKMLSERIGPTSVIGRADDLETFADGQRLTLSHAQIGGLARDKAPALLRIRLRGSQPTMRPGDVVRVRAVLAPPTPPAVPGGYDFQREAYFDGLGAVGYSVGSATVLSAGEDRSWGGIGLWFAGMRAVVAERVRAHLSGATAAVTIALLNGEQRAIPDRVMAAIRDSGLAHLLSISGLHIGLVAGIVLLVVRGGLALIPPLAVRFAIKKWAALAAAAAAGAYTLLADAPVPAQRSFLMIAIVLLAMLVDRQGISLRLLAFAAVAILITQPEAMLGASFQMSFAAVLALMSAYEFARARRHAPEAPPAPLRRMFAYLAGIVLSTLIAGMATAPFAAYHFDRFQVYGVPANMVAIPVTGFWIMPWAVLAVMLMPVGLEGWALVPLGWGVDVVIRVAEQVASWPGAVVLLPAMPTWALAAITLGGLWLCIWQGQWRLLGMAGIILGVAATLGAEAPDLFIDSSGRLMAARTADGGLMVSSRMVGRSTREAWLRRSGQRYASEYWPKNGASADGSLRCDALGCVYRANGHIVAIAARGEALIEDCRLADVVISLTPVRRSCASAGTVLDRFDLWREGAHAIWLESPQVSVESVNRSRGDRPWVVRPAQRSAEHQAEPVANALLPDADG
jgi:competence protein ComEC